MKTFCVIICLLMLALIQQIIYAQQPLAQQAFAIFEQHCLDCHGEFGSYSDVLTIKHKDLIENRSVIPGQPDASELYLRLLGDTDNGSQMPLGQEPLEPAAIATIRRWIEARAPDWEAIPKPERGFITTEVMLKTIHTHVTSLTAFDRSFARYFTLTHLYNAGASDDNLRAYRNALSKLVNSLSWGSEVIKPKPIDREETIFYIDLRHYEWDIKSDKWYKDDEKPMHTVYVNAFYIDKYEVTNTQYKKFVDANPQWQKDRIPRKYHDGDYLKHWNGNDYPHGKGNHPVIYVSWYAAMAYAQWSGKRLPIETEWEKAARGGLVGKKYAWGDSLDFSQANYGESVGDTTSIGTYPANGYGLYDMAGNVWEWCLDEYDADFYSISPLHNPLAGGTVDNILSDFTNVKNVRVLRGGSWVSNAKFVRVSDRTRFTPQITNKARGFRCVKSVTP